jgi:hypothetical protein
MLGLGLVQPWQGFTFALLHLASMRIINGEGKFLKFYIEFNCLDHERIAQGFKFGSRVRIDPRAPKTLFRLFEPKVWSRSVWHEYHELMLEALSVLR